MIDTSKGPSELSISTVQHILPREINLGTHHLLLHSDQSIELMCTAQGAAEPTCVLCLDTTETYRLMQCLGDLFKQTTNG